MPLDFAPRPQSAPANTASSRRDTAFAKLRTETLLRKLEPRIMFDAAALATAVDALHHDAADSHSHTGDVSHSSLAAADIAGLAAGSHGPIVVQSVANFKQVVFIDAGVQDPAAIEQAAGPNDEIVLLDPHEDGLTQIAQFLAGHEGLDAVHIVSHGAAGELILGSSTYNSSTIKGFDAELAAIGASLQPGGDILLYGCDVAQGAVGDAFVHKIADLTHANVSASTDLTGNAAQGGNWVLEDHVGAVHTAAIQAQAWQGELGSLVTVSSNNTAVSNTFQNNLIGPGITATNETQIGVASQFGTFDLTGKATKLPLSQGIVMVTGNAGTALTTSGNTAADFSSNTNGATSTSGNFTYNSSTPVTEVNLNGVAGGAGIWNPAGYIFDFTAATNRIGFVFSFASEEYQNYVGSIFNDAFGFFIKGGTQYAATTNLALVPGTSEGISINTINSGVAGSAAPGAPAASWDASNSKLYIDNSFGSAGADPYVQYNGLTKLLTVTAPVTAGTSYHMEISIGDAGDNALDSAVFFHNQGFLALTSASNNAYATAENATVSGNVISDNTGNGADLSAVGGMSVTAINGAAFGVSPVTLASGAQVTMHSDGTFIYDPTHSTAAQALLIGQSLNDTFTYTNTDSSGVTDTATVTIKVTNTDHAPVASNDAFGTSAGVAVKIPVLANDTDVDAGDVLTVSQVAGHAITAGGAAVAVTGGSVTLDSSGNLTFSPTAGYTGAASFTYTIDDGHHGTSTATVSGHVYAAPVAVADSFTTAHDTTATINVLGNDTDANGFSLAVTAVNGTAVTTTTAPIAVTGGTVILDAAGQLEFSANAGFTGPASFAYTVDDGHGGKAIGTVSGSVTDAAPIVDLNGAAAGASYVTTFTEGSAAVAIAAPTSTVVDADNTTMQSAKIVLTNAQASDVLALGLLPTGIAGAVDTSVAGKVTVTLTGTATSADYAAAIQAIAFSNASQNPNTTARTIDVTVNDGMLSSAIVVSTVQVVAVDNPPVETVPAPVATNANAPVTITGLSVSDVDANGGIETVTLSAAHGTITLGSTAGLTFTTGAGAAVPAMTFKGTLAQIDAAIASLTYAPGANYAGADTLTFTTNDNGNTGSGGPLAATQTLALNVMDVPPTAHDDSFTTAAGSSVKIAELANDVSPVGLPLTVTQVNGTAIDAAHPVTLADGSGIVSLNADGTLNFAPTSGYAGTPSFTYTISDGYGAPQMASINGTVWAPPALMPDTVHTAAGVPATIPALANDTDPNGFALTISGINGSAIIAGGAAVAVDHGTVTLKTDGTLLYMPAAGFTGLDTFAYTVSDAHGGTASANVTVSIFPPPIAGNDGFATAAGAVDTIPVLANDSDPNAGFNFGITAVNGTAVTANGPAVAVTGGTVALDDSGNLIFTPNAGYAGTPSFTYSITDDHGGQATATVNGLVYAPPAPVADTFGTGQGAATTVPVLANDTDPNGFALTITNINGQPITAGGSPVTVGNGAVALVGGALVYTPNTGYSGADSFTYTVSDGHGGAATATVNGAVYAPPAAVNDMFAVNAGSVATVNALANDTDVNHFPLTITSVNGTPLTLSGATVPVTGGAVGLDAFGNLDFTPNPGFVGKSSFTYGVSDGHGSTASATVNGTVYGPPVANPDSFMTASGVTVIIPALANDTDPNGLPLSITKVNGAAITAGGAPVAVGHGTVALNLDGTLAFVPAAGYSGPVSFAYTATDGHTTPVTAGVTGSILLPPVATPDNFGTTTGVPVDLALLANDIDPAGLPLVVTAINGAAITAGGTAVPVGHGSVAMSASGVLTYTPATGYSGPEIFSYTVSDGHGGTAAANVTGNVVFVDHAPLGADSSVTTLEDTPVTLTAANFGFSDPSDTPANALAGVIIGTLPASGTLTDNGIAVKAGDAISAADIAAGKLVYAPSANANGPGLANFTFQVQDNGGTANGGIDTSVTPNTLSFNVTPVNDAPVETVPNAPSVAAGKPLVISGLTVNDIDANGGKETVTLSVGNGTLALPSVNGLTFSPGTGAGAATMTFSGSLADINSALSHLAYTATPGYGGQDTLTFTTTDNGNTGIGGPLSATLSLPITVWAPPAVAPDTFAIAAGKPVVIAPLANDTDPNGFALTVAAINGAPVTVGTPVAVQGGTVTLDAGGQLTFTPAPGYAGTPSFAYTVDDGHGGAATATVNGTVWAPPVAKLDHVVTAAGQPVTVMPQVNDTDVNGFGLTICRINGKQIVQGGAPVAVDGGLVTLGANGVLTYAPSAGFSGTPAFTYTVNDGHGGHATNSVLVDVYAPPALHSDTFQTVAGNPVTLSPLANDTDPNGFALTVSGVDGHAVVAGGLPVAVAGGSVTLDPAGNLTFVPAPGFSGSPAFTYTVSDGHGGSATSTISGTVVGNLNITQFVAGLTMHSSGAAGPVSSPESSDGLSTGDEFIHPVAGLDAGGASPSGSGEHIRLVVEGSTHQLDKQYGAGAGGVPLRTLMGGGHEAAGGGATVYEPNTQAPFWSGLVPFDFTARPSTHGVRLDGQGADDAALAAWFDGASIPFSDQIALIRGRFDRAAMQLGEDLADVA